MPFSEPHALWKCSGKNPIHIFISPLKCSLVLIKSLVFGEDRSKAHMDVLGFLKLEEFLSDNNILILKNPCITSRWDGAVRVFSHWDRTACEPVLGARAACQAPRRGLRLYPASSILTTALWGARRGPPVQRMSLRLQKDTRARGTRPPNLLSVSVTS